MDVERSQMAREGNPVGVVDAAPSEGDTPHRREGAALAAVILLALVLRTWVAVRNPVIFDDGPDFIEIARAMARGDFGGALAHPFHPLYSALIWWTPASAGHEASVGIAWSVLAGTAAVAGVAWLMRPFFGPRLAVIAAALLAAHPYAVRMSSDVQSDGVFLALFVLALGGVHRSVERADAAIGFAAGVATALAYLTRPEGAGIVVVAAVLLVGEWVQGRSPGRRVLLVAASVGAGFALLALPYMRVIWLLSGEWQLTQKKSFLALIGLGHVQAATGLGVAVGFGVVVALAVAISVRRRGGLDLPPFREWRPGVSVVTAAFFALIIGAWLVSPASLVRYVAILGSTLRPEVALLLIIGIAVSASRRRAPSGRAYFFATTAVVYGMVTFGLLVSAGYLSRRHLMPMTVVSLGYASVGLDAIAGWIANRSKPPLGSRTHAFASLMLVVVCIGIAAPKVFRTHREEAVAARLAAEWVRDVAAPGDRLASDRPRTAYYADLVWVPIRKRDVPDGDLQGGEDLRRLGVRWVIAGKHELAESEGPQYARSAAPGQRLELVHEVEQHGFRALVFEVHEPGVKSEITPD